MDQGMNNEAIVSPTTKVGEVGYLEANGRGNETTDGDLRLNDLSGDGAVDLSVVVPAYNEEQRLPPMLNETLAFLEQRRAQSAGSSLSRTNFSADTSTGASGSEFSYEIIVVDDGSRDRTVDVVSRFIEKVPGNRVRLLQLTRNSGKGAAVRHGMQHARGARILMADADAATNFSDLEQLETALNHGADVAIGSRAHLRRPSSSSSRFASNDNTSNKDKHASKDAGHRDFLRALVSLVFNLLVVLIGGVRGLSDTQCGFKLYSRRAARAAFVGQHLTRWAFDVENLYRVQRARLSVVEVPVRWTEVPGSKLSVIKATINMAWDMFRMRYHYLIGSWTLPTPSSPISMN